MLRFLQNALAGAVVIAALLAAGSWYASDPEMRVLGLCQDPTAAAPQSPDPGCHVSFVDWSADGRTLLALSRGRIGTLARLTLHLLDEETTTIPIDTMQEVVTTAALAPDGQHVLVGSAGGRLWWIESASSEAAIELVDLPGLTSFSATAIADDGGQVAGGTNEGSVCLCDLARRTCSNLPTSRNGSVTSLRFSHDGQRLVSANGDGRISVWDLETGMLLQEFAGHRPAPVAAEFLLGGTRVISAGFADTVRIWDVASARQLWQGEFDLSAVTTLAVSTDGTLAAWGGCNHRIIVWDLQTGQQRLDISTPAYVLFHLNFSPDGSLLAAAGTEGLVRLYDTRTAAEQNGIDVAGAAREGRQAKAVPGE